MRTDGEAEDVARVDGEGWLDRMEKERPAAEKTLDPGDAFQPHHGDETDLNTLTADLLADPDPSFDPFRAGAAATSRQDDAPPAAADDAKPASPPAAPAEGKRLGPAVAHTYAAAAPGRAQYRGSVAHAVDATYGDVDPHAVVKTTQALIDHVYSTQEEAVTGDAEHDDEEAAVSSDGEDSARP